MSDRDAVPMPLLFAIPGGCWIMNTSIETSE